MGKRMWIIQLTDFHGMLHPPSYTDDPNVLEEYMQWWTKGTPPDRFLGGPEGVIAIRIKRATEEEVRREVFLEEVADGAQA